MPDRSVGRTAASGMWCLEVYTEGNHDDGTAWAVTSFESGSADGFEVSLDAWSGPESFNTLRHFVVVLGPECPTDLRDFPEPGTNLTERPVAPVGGIREPLHQSAGWREYSFTWEPETVPDRLWLAVGVSVVRETDAEHYLADISVDPG